MIKFIRTMLECRKYGWRLAFFIAKKERSLLKSGWPQDAVNEYIATSIIGG
jgi:hypothetical protein